MGIDLPNPSGLKPNQSYCSWCGRVSTWGVGTERYQLCPECRQAVFHSDTPIEEVAYTLERAFAEGIEIQMPDGKIRRVTKEDLKRRKRPYAP